MKRPLLFRLRRSLLICGLMAFVISGHAAEIAESRPFADLNGVTHAEFNPDGTRIVVVTRQPAIGLWDVASGQPVAGDLQPGTAVGQHLFSDDHRAVLVGFPDGGSRVFDTTTGKALTPRLEATLLEGESSRAAFSPDGKRVIILEAELASVYQIPSGQREAKLPAKTSSAGEEPDMNATAAFTADGAQCFLLTGTSVTRYDTATWKPIGKPLRHPAAESAYHIGFALSPDDRWMATFDDPGENGPKGHLQAWDLAKARTLGKPFVAVNGMEGRFFAPGNRLLVLPGRGEASVRELPSLKPLATVKQHDEVEGPNAATSPDGKWLISWGSDRDLRLIETATGKVVDRFAVGATISKVLPLPDSSGVLVVCDNSTFLLQDHHDHYVLRFTFPEMRPTHTVRIVKFLAGASLSPDGRSLALIVGKTDQEHLLLYDTANLQPK
jgi:WD40 repeat protein